MTMNTKNISTYMRVGFSGIKAKLFRDTPFLLTLKPTFRCNLKCDFCDTGKHGTKLFPEKKELDTGAFKEIIRRAKAENITIVSFTGGEPFLRTDLIEIAEYAKKLGLYTMVNTNGTLLENLIKAKKLTCFDSIRISLDGIKSHDKIRGVKSTYKKAIQAIKLGIKEKLPITINSTITKETLSEMKDLSNLSKKLKAQLTFSPMILHEYPTGKRSKDCKYSIPDMHKFIHNIRVLKKNNPYISNSNFFLNQLSKDSRKKNRECSISNTTVIILPNGKMALPCEANVISITDRKKTIKETIKSNKKLLKNCGNFEFCEHCHSRCRIFPNEIANPFSALEILKNWG